MKNHLTDMITGFTESGKTKLGKLLSEELKNPSLVDGEIWMAKDSIDAYFDEIEHHWHENENLYIELNSFSTRCGCTLIINFDEEDFMWEGNTNIYEDIEDIQQLKELKKPHIVNFTEYLINSHNIKELKEYYEFSIKYQDEDNNSLLLPYSCILWNLNIKEWKLAIKVSYCEKELKREL